MCSAFGLVIFLKAFAEPVRLNANDRVSLLIEVLRTAERFNRNVVLLDLAGRTFEVLGADVSQQLGETGCTAEYAGGQDRVQLGALALEIGCSLHTLELLKA